MYSRVGYGKMDYPTQRAIYHCHREREGAKERDSEERGKEREAARGWDEELGERQLKTRWRTKRGE